MAALIRCDVCERPKGAGNHWAAYSRTALATGRLEFAEWNEEAARYDGSVCGESCAHRLLATFLNGEFSRTTN